MASKVEEELLKACIIIVGNQGCGKSTVLNNIFDIGLKTGCSPKPVTTIVEKNEIRKKSVEFTVVDTPGGAELKRQAKELKKQIKEVQNYTVLLCLRVDSGSRVNDVSVRDTVVALQASLGSKVWSKCVVLLTFSDLAREEWESVDEYKSHINQCTKALEGIIKTACRGAKVSAVKSLLELDNIRDRDDCEDEIIAFPVGTKESSGNILPGVLLEDEDWTDLLFVEIMRKTEEAKRDAFFLLKYNEELSYFVNLATKMGENVGANIEAWCEKFEWPLSDFIVAVLSRSIGIHLPVGALDGVYGTFHPTPFASGAVKGAQIGAKMAERTISITGPTIRAIQEFIKRLKAIKKQP